MEKIKKVEGALARRVFSGVSMLVLFVCTLLGFSSCAEEILSPLSNLAKDDTVAVIRDLYWRSERVGLATVSVQDLQAKSTADFKQTSSFYNEQEGVSLSFEPTAYLNIRLSKSRIEVLTEDELPVTLVKAYVESRRPYKDQITFGEDVVKIFEYSDGQKATVSYGYRYTGVEVGSDTLDMPHVEVDDVVYVQQNLTSLGEKTETEDPYMSELAFQADYTIRGTSSDEVTSSVLLKPWYQKVVSSEPTEILNVSYEGKFVNCPVDMYELVENVTTNKSTFSNTYQVPLSLVIRVPEKREQPSLDSLFNTVSVGKYTEQVFSEAKNEDGFTVRTMTGSYVSTNTGKQAKTAIESVVNFTYQYPVKFESEYGTYEISPLALKFKEIGFQIKKVSESKESKLFRTTNMIEGTLGTCALNVIDEVVDLRVQQGKAPDLVKTDSTYVLKGGGDDYIVDKTIVWSDGSKTTSTYSYTGRHSATALSFGNKVTTSLAWNVNALQRASELKENEEKKFSDVTKFAVVYTTATWNAEATNGVQRGTFGFKETTPVVTFIDGAISKTFPERKYTLTGKGSEVADRYTMMVVSGVSYKAYAYNYGAELLWGQEKQPDLTSNGYLLMSADEEPPLPHLGKPKAFRVTATFDPTNKVTRRAFVFNWENGVTYAVCDYETMLPQSSDFMFKQDSYSGYNSVGYDKNNSVNHWQPARGVDSSDAIRWYTANGALMSAIDKALSCKVIGWKNVVKGDYALDISGYTYDIVGYNIIVKAPDGKTVSFNSHYNP